MLSDPAMSVDATITAYRYSFSADAGALSLRAMPRCSLREFALAA